MQNKIRVRNEKWKHVYDSILSWYICIYKDGFKELSDLKGGYRKSEVKGEGLYCKLLIPSSCFWSISCHAFVSLDSSVWEVSAAYCYMFIYYIIFQDKYEFLIKFILKLKMKLALPLTCVFFFFYVILHVKFPSDCYD